MKLDQLALSMGIFAVSCWLGNEIIPAAEVSAADNSVGKIGSLFDGLAETEPCAKSGDPACRSNLANILISLGKEGVVLKKYGGDEIVYLIKSSVYVPYHCDEAIDREERALCAVEIELAMAAMAKIYREGLYDLPTNEVLEECWERRDPKLFPRCEYLELKHLNYIPHGQRPIGFK